jgi:hypothetical protein
LKRCIRRKTRLNKIIPIKGNLLGLEGGVLRASGMPPCSESTKLEMIKTYSVDTSLLKRGVGSAEDGIGVTTLVDLTLSKRRVGSIEDRDDVMTFSINDYIGWENTWSKGTSPIKRGVGSADDCIEMTTLSTNG